MATADEILAAEFGLDDIWFEVDLLSRQIVIPKAVTNLGVQSDADVMHVRFKLPRFYYDVDFSEFKIGIDYTNAEGEEDRYEPKDIKIVGNVVTFTWIVGRHAALYKGNVTFGLCAKRLNPADPDDPHNEFHTTKATLPILDGMETCEEAIVMHTDLLEQWREQLFGEKDSLLADITAASEAQQKAIEDKAAASLASIPPDYTETYQLAHDSVRTRANAIVCVGEGETVDIRDASDDHLRGLRVFGKTTQLKTLGTQLFDCSKLTDLSGQGISMNNDGTGRITVDGKSNAPSSSVNIKIEGLTPGTYYVSGEIPGKMFFYVRYTKADGSYKYVKALESFTIDGTETDFLGYLYAPTAGVTFNKDVIYPMLNVGTVPLPWEPYTGGIASPSPKCPQPLKSVDNPTIRVCGKNLINLPQVIEKTNNLYNNDLYTGQNGAGQTIPSIYFDRLPVLKAGVSYYFSYDIEGDNTNQLVFLQKVDPDGTTNMAGVLLDRPGVVCVDEDTMVTLRANSNTQYTIKNLQLEIGIERTEYESYKDLASVTLNQSLHAIPVAADGNYVDSKGQQWICDEVDLERGVHVQRVHTVVLDGSETISREERSNGTYRFVLRQTGAKRMQPIVGGCCSHFKYGIEPIGANDVNNVMCFWNTGYPYCRYDDATSVDAMATWLAAQYEAGTPVTIKGVLETPIETPLTQEEIEAFQQMHTNFPRTIVLNDSAAWMEVKYNADTKTFLDNTFRPTDEQVQTAVNAWLEAYMAEHPASGNALTTEQITAINELFKIAAYTDDASTKYAAFRAAFGLDNSDGDGDDESGAKMLQYTIATMNDDSSTKESNERATTDYIPYTNGGAISISGYKYILFTYNADKEFLAKITKSGLTPWFDSGDTPNATSPFIKLILVEEDFSGDLTIEQGQLDGAIVTVDAVEYTLIGA